MLRKAGRSDLEVEVVFPVSSRAISTPEQATSGSRGADGGGGGKLELPTGLSLVPGPASGEGCSLEGGCAACPYMRMNTLEALQLVAERVSKGGFRTRVCVAI
jgi:quinolinate synthase